MKKIKKVNRISAQSVYSFGCACDGYCSPNCVCNASDSKSSNHANEMMQSNPHAGTRV